MLLTILEGSTFAISDDLGDMVAGVHGLYADDTRLLSRSRLTIDGVAPLLLTSQVVEYFDSAHYLRNAPTDRLPVDSLSIARERFVEQALTERFVVRNETAEVLELTIALELASDFADIISVKAHDFALGDPERATPLPPAMTPVSVIRRLSSCRTRRATGRRGSRSRERRRSGRPARRSRSSSSHVGAGSS